MDVESQENLTRQGYAVARFGGQTLIYLDPKRLKFSEDKQIIEMCTKHFPLEELARRYRYDSKFPNIFRGEGYVQVELPSVVNFDRPFTKKQLREFKRKKDPAILHPHFDAPTELAKLLVS